MWHAPVVAAFQLLYKYVSASSQRGCRNTHNVAAALILPLKARMFMESWSYSLGLAFLSK